MLHLKEISDITNVKIEFDFYIPVKIKFGDWEHRGTSVYWSARGINGSIFDIGIGEISKTIYTITMVSAPKVISRKSEEHKKAKTEQQGNPAFNIDCWQKNLYYLEEPCEFEFCIENNDIVITFAHNDIELTVTNDRVVFCFNKNNFLCSVRIKDMTSAEKAEMEEGLRARGVLD